jgi:murein DD-endopeptidase MepM/ murein hydrolase activator NlpD
MRADIFGDRSDLESYSIFGAELYSPCTGRIAVAMDDYEDLVPPATDPEHPAGNHVLVECEGVEVLLAHLKRGSVTVEVGDSVTVETVLGQVGNTGNTSEPHLHIHAEQGGEPGVILDGRAVPITIDGRFLVRGDIIAER